MLKLNKARVKAREQLIDRLRNQADAVECAVDDLNTELDILRDKVREEIAEYNAILEEASTFCEEVATEISEELEERSEAWQESEKGELALGWQDQWNCLSFDEVELELPEDVAFERPTHAEDIEEIPTQPE